MNHVLFQIILDLITMKRYHCPDVEYPHEVLLLLLCYNRVIAHKL
jgi:hypothetical protein